jgi:microcystin-dependent protein
MDGYYGVVTTFAGTFAPRNWQLCDGQLVSIASNTALFAIIGTMYGGNGTTTFGLPDLRGRVPVGVGQGPGLSNYSEGQVQGAETITLIANQLPLHDHTGQALAQLQADSSNGIDPTPNDAYPSRFTGAYAAATNATMLAPEYTGTIGNTGGGQPIPIRAPYNCINYIICVFGIFPSRN